VAECPQHAEFRGILIGIALGETLPEDAGRVAEVRRHVAACEVCRAELEAFQSLVAALTPPPIPNEDEVVAEIAANVRRNVFAVLAARERRERVRRYALVLTASVVLAVAVVLLIPTDIPGERGPAARSWPVVLAVLLAASVVLGCASWYQRRRWRRG
jgi:hypothetical protein